MTFVSPDNAVTGSIVLTQKSCSSDVNIAGEIKGLADGEHGFHIHAWGNLTGGCAATGGHYNPFNKTHGAPDAKARHVGDLGNIVSKDKVAKVDITDDVITLCGRRSIMGRGVVIHADRDDLGLGSEWGWSVLTADKPDSKTTGAAGARVACGIIGVVEYV